MAFEQRVAVIGCGAAGLCMLKHLTYNSGKVSRILVPFEVVGFEQQSQIGGTWVYNDKVSFKEKHQPRQCNIYENLKTNLPKDIMSFQDFPYPTNAPSFLHHTEVLNYLEDYARHFDLHQYIKFQTQVIQVEPCLCEACPPNQVRWKISFQNCQQPSPKESEMFDAVVVCNGHFSEPYSPKFLDQEKFQGTILHSHDYRSPKKFSGKNIVCVGAKSSGIDIGIELCSVARNVYLSHRDEPLISELPRNMIQKPEIQQFTSDSVIFKNGERQKVDSVVLCTGYKYSFPFLHTRCKVATAHNHITPLYKHLIHIHFHNFFFLGICLQSAPFPMLDMQAAFCKAVLRGQVNLPSTNEMKRAAEEDLKERFKSGLSKRHAHIMGERQWKYNDELADMSHIPRLSEKIKRIYNYVQEKRRLKPMKYKSMSIFLEDK